MKQGMFRVLDVTFVAMLFDCLIAAVMLVFEAKHTDVRAIWVFPLQVEVHLVPILVLLYLMFKMKKVQILLNYNDQDPQEVLKELKSFINRMRIGLLLFIFQMIVQLVGATIYTLQGLVGVKVR